MLLCARLVNDVIDDMNADQITIRHTVDKLIACNSLLMPSALSTLFELITSHSDPIIQRELQRFDLFVYLIRLFFFVFISKTSFVLDSIFAISKSTFSERVGLYIPF